MGAGGLSLLTQKFLLTRKRGKEKMENGEEKKENWIREGGKLKWKGEKLKKKKRRGPPPFFFSLSLFFCFSLFKTTEIVLGLPKWEFSNGKKHFTMGKKSGKMTLPTPKIFLIHLCKGRQQLYHQQPLGASIKTKYLPETFNIEFSFHAGGNRRIQRKPVEASMDWKPNAHAGIGNHTWTQWCIALHCTREESLCHLFLSTDIRGHNWVHFAHRLWCTVTLNSNFAILLFSIRVKELLEPIVLWKGDRFLLFLKTFSWETDL